MIDINSLRTNTKGDTMNLRFLKQLNEDHDKRMSSEEMVSYMTLLHKKCSKTAKEDFHEYLEEECDVEEADFKKCCEILCKDKDQCDKVIHHLEGLSERVDESSLVALLKGDTGEDTS